MRLFTNDGMHHLLGQLAARGRNGIRLMRTLLAERPPGYVPPQSGLEARVERLAREVGVELRRQVNVGDQEWIGRVDFEIPGSTDVIEVLSERFHSALLDRVADDTRFRRIEATGRRVLTIWDSDVWGDAEAVRQQILSFCARKTRAIAWVFRAKTGSGYGGNRWPVDSVEGVGDECRPSESEEIVKHRIVALLAVLVVLGACSGITADGFQVISSQPEWRPQPKQQRPSSAKPIVPMRNRELPASRP